MIKLICQQCGREFLTRKRSDRIVKFCDSTCYGLSKIGNPTWNKGIPCREETKNKLSEINKGKHSSPKTEFRKGQTSKEKNINWNGGIWTTVAGYKMLLRPKHHRSNCRGYVMEHILVAEKFYRRKLLDNEIVHHINGIKDDNRPENLVIMDAKDHKKMHSFLRERNSSGRFV
jgi:hypothetical protein